MISYKIPDRYRFGIFSKKNRRGSSYRIIILFFLLSVSILFLTHGQVEVLAGVYIISFLSVMGLFGIGNILLKLRRKTLPRPEKASWISVFIAVLFVTIALAGNVIKEPEAGEPANLTIFLEYFIPTMLFVGIMLNRTALLKMVLNFVEYLFMPIAKMVSKINRGVSDLIDRITSQEFVFFTRGDNLANLNKVLLYIKNNEHTKKIKIVTVQKKYDKEFCVRLRQDIEFLDREYPEIDIEYVELTGAFGPDLIQKLSKQWNVPVNFMFIGSPGDRFPYRIEELGGVRLII